MAGGEDSTIARGFTDGLVARPTQVQHLRQVEIAMVKRQSGKMKGGCALRVRGRSGKTGGRESAKQVADGLAGKPRSTILTGAA
jgi:hypothetical protein